MPMKHGWYPPASPHCLIQESLFPNEWLILVACVMLNCTQRRQVERVWPAFVRAWPDAMSLSTADPAAVEAIVAPLGFGKRRAVTLIRLSQDYLRPGWTDARALSGVGEYAGRAHDVFCRGVLSETAPNDHALTKYWHFVKSLKHPVSLRKDVT